MQIATLSLMRQEFLLIFLTVIILFLELVIKDKNRRIIFPVTIILFTINFIIGLFTHLNGQLFGGMFITSPTHILMKNILNFGVIIVLLQSEAWLKKDFNKNKSSEFLMILLSTLIGMYFLISAGDFLMFYIGLEIASIPMAILAAYDRYSSKSAEAGIKYLLNAALSSGIMLFGISLFYGISGTIYFSDLPQYISNPTPIFALAFIFFISGLAFKLALVPFHLWAADVYEGAPTIVTSYLSVISKGAAAFITAILLFKVFYATIEMWRNIIYALSILTMIVGNLFALRQTNIKRFLAFSSIAQAGFILLGLLSVDSLGMASIIYFVFIYILSNLAAFGVVMAIENATGKVKIADYDGLYRTNPRLSLIMMLALFSLAGIPPIAGFFSKFFLFAAAAKGGFYWLVFIAVANTIIALYYYLMIVKAMFINKNETPIENIHINFYTRTAFFITVTGLFITGFVGTFFDYIKAVVDKF